MLGRRVGTHLLVGVHAGKATGVAGLATFLGSRLDFFLGPGRRSASLRDSCWGKGTETYRFAKFPGFVSAMLIDNFRGRFDFEVESWFGVVDSMEIERERTMVTWASPGSRLFI